MRIRVERFDEVSKDFDVYWYEFDKHNNLVLTQHTDTGGRPVVEVINACSWAAVHNLDEAEGET